MGSAAVAIIGVLPERDFVLGYLSAFRLRRYRLPCRGEREMAMGSSDRRRDFVAPRCH